MGQGGATESVPGKKEITDRILQLLQEYFPLGTGHTLCYYEINYSQSHFLIILLLFFN